MLPYVPMNFSPKPEIQAPNLYFLRQNPQPPPPPPPLRNSAKATSKPLQEVKITDKSEETRSPESTGQSERSWKTAFYVILGNVQHLSWEMPAISKLSQLLVGSLTACGKPLFAYRGLRSLQDCSTVMVKSMLQLLLLSWSQVTTHASCYS